MKPSNLVARLLEDANDGANLTKQELQTIYLNDYTGDLGLVDVVYLGPSPSDATSEKGGGPPSPVRPKSHEYLALMDAGDMAEDGEQWLVTHLYVQKGSPSAGPDQLTMEFAGAPMFASSSQKTARDFFNKESHMRGHRKAVAAGKQASRDAAENEAWREQQRARVASGAYRGGRRGMSGGGQTDSPHWDGNRYAL